MGESKKFQKRKKPFDKNKKGAQQTRKPEKIVSFQRDRRPIVESTRLSDLVKKSHLGKGKTLNDLLREQKSLMTDFEKMEKDVQNIKKRPSYKERRELAMVPYTNKPPALPAVKEVKKLPLVPYQAKPVVKRTKKKTPKKVCTNQTKTVVYHKKKSDGSKDKYYEMKQVYRKCQKKAPKRRKSKPKV